MSKLKKPWHGVDVSDHQGVIDWDNLIKEQQIDFAIIRTSWGTEGLDKQFKNNIEACIRLNIPFGVYHYSYIGDGIENYSGEERRNLLHDQAISEAKFFLNVIAPYEFYLDLPVFMDIEDDSRNKYLGQLTNEELNFVVTTFCNFMGSRNYLTGIYANKSWLDNKLNYVDLANGREDVRGVYDVWVAEWTGINNGEQHSDKSNYKQVHYIWQYTSQKKTNCTSGTKNLDCNLCYVDYPALLETNGLNGRWATGFVDLIKQASNNRWLQIKKGNDTTKYLIGEEPFWMFKDNHGRIVKGWVASGDKWYFTRPDVGVMLKGLQQIDGDIYYLDYTTGAMASNCWLDTVNGIRYARPNGKFARNIPGQAFIKWRINDKDVTFDPSGDIYEDKAMLAQCKYAPECLDENGNVINLVCDPTPIKVEKPDVPEPQPEPEPIEPEKPIETYICKVYDVYGLDSREKHLQSSKVFKQGDKFHLEFFNKLEENLKLEYVKIFQYDNNKELFIEIDTKEILTYDRIIVENDSMPATDVEIVAYYSHVDTPVEPSEPTVPEDDDKRNKWLIALFTAILAGIVWLISLFA